MPPRTEPPVVPTSLGLQTRQWLEHHGVVAATPTIRSSDWELSANPFQYYLSRRLGLVPALSWSKALSRGSYFHIPFSMYDDDKRWVVYQQAVAARCTELREMCKELAILPEKVQEIIDRELRDATYARGWYQATETVQFKRRDGGPRVTFQGYMNMPHWRKVGAEIRVVYNDPNYPGTPLVIQLDVLLLNTKQNTLWIIDAKTCSSTPIIRLTSVRNEFQTQHYMTTVARCLEEGRLQRMLDLPQDTKLGGMIHVAVQKPTIRFGQKDRPFRWMSYGKGKCTEGAIYQSAEKDKGTHYAQWKIIPNGKGKGTEGTSYGSHEQCLQSLHEATGKKPEKEFFGEPSLNLFIDRCEQWYLDEQIANEDDPPVNMSITGAAVLGNSMWLTMYEQRLQSLHDMATREPTPIHYPRMMRGVESHGKLSPYAMFYVTDPGAWPEIIRDKKFISRRRDEDIEGVTETMLETSHMQE